MGIATTGTPGASDYVLANAIGALTEEANTTAKGLSGTGIVGSLNVNVEGETFIGQLRWDKPLKPVINVASLVDPTAGDTTSSAQDFLTYIKTVRTSGSQQPNIQAVVTQQDGLQRIAREFARTQMNDTNDAMLSVLKGVATAEVLYGAASASGQAGLGGQTFDNDPESNRYGFYVDLGANKPVVAASAAVQGAARAEGFLQAIGMAWKDYEPQYAYLVVSPEVFASLRSANLVDENAVTEANVTFSTIFNGKFRLLQTRASQSFLPADLTKLNGGAGVDVVGTKTSFVVLPGAMGFAGINVPVPVEITRDGSKYKGSGVTNIWNRWGYVLAPAGYDWKGSTTAFPSNADYMSVVEANAPKALSAAASGLAGVTGVWGRKASSALSLGILPIFHG